jgi:hypothetical protein
MQYNISPETLNGQYSRFANSERFNDDGTLVDYQVTDSIGMLIDDRALDDLSIRNQLTEQNVTITPTGCTGLGIIYMIGVHLKSNHLCRQYLVMEK